MQEPPRLRVPCQTLVILMALVIIAYWSGVVVGWRVRSVTAQAPWSSLRLIADPPIVGAVIRAERAPDGTVSQDRRQIAYIGPQDADRVADVVLDPSMQYVVGCGFTLRDDVTYETDIYLPITVRPRVTPTGTFGGTSEAPPQSEQKGNTSTSSVGTSRGTR